jgi:hypothetical protein
MELCSYFLFLQEQIKDIISSSRTVDSTRGEDTVSRQRGRVAARERTRAVTAVRAALTDAALAGGGPESGGVAGGGSAAGSMAAVVNFNGFDTLLRTYMVHRAMLPDEGLVFIGDRRDLPASAGRSPFGQGPDDMAAFATIHEIIHKFNTCSWLAAISALRRI